MELTGFMHVNAVGRATAGTWSLAELTEGRVGLVRYVEIASNINDLSGRLQKGARNRYASSI